MSKLSIGQHGIQVETHEKTNVMSPYHTMAFLVISASIALILFGNEHWIKILGALIFVIFIVVWIVIYICHSIKKPDLLQSESYRIEIHKIEAGMIEAKQGEIVESPPLLETNQLGAITSKITNETTPDEEEML